MKSVAIITRTKNRPVMLKRALKSISGQVYKDLVWVIVNDGGDVAEVQTISDSASKIGIDVRVIHNKESLGMEAAANIGIQNTQSKYITIHDDDDTWDKFFLKKTVEFIENQPECENNAGVVTKVVRINEFIHKNNIFILDKSSYNKDLKIVTLIDVASLYLNPPPISFLYHRTVHDEIGLYDEKLPVLGDWDFLLRYLMKFKMGVIEEELANYHIRPNISKGIYGNTIVANNEKHKKWEAYIIDKYLRHDIKQGVAGLGIFLYQNKQFRNIDHQIYSVRRLSFLIQWGKGRVELAYFFLKSLFRRFIRLPPKN